MSRFNPGAVLPIELELLKEKASALRHTGYKLEKLIERMSALETQLPSLKGAALTSAVQEHGALRKQAEDERWKMIVQREAMGLTRHDDVYRHYPIPRALDQS